MQKRWAEIPLTTPELIPELQASLQINEVLARLLVLRGVHNYDEARDFFRPNIHHLHDPFLMQDMEHAIERIEQAIAQQEKILVYGDYDVDGTTAVALVYRFFSKYYNQLEYYIPDRYLEGYGISYKGIDYAAENNFNLIIALDCGIKSVDHVAYAKAKDVDFIICDHHLPGEHLPDAVAVLDPKRPDCNYPYKELAGCGIGFKLIQAYTQKNDLPFEDLEAYLDLVAVSIAADIVPIDGENRTLAWFGMKRLNEQPCAGLAALRSIAKQKPYYTLSDAVFQLGPRINAAGRIADAKQAVRLLSSNNQPEALEIAKLIDVHNDERRGHDSDITEQALAQVESGVDFKTRKSTVVFNESWHKGVIGIVASRLTEKYYRPTVVLTQSNGVVAGSARSVMGFDLYEALLACTDLLEQFGGHKYAAGLTMKAENVRAFQQRFEEVVTASISDELLVQEISIDSPLNLAQIDAKFFRILSQFEPFGPKNMSPVFIASGLELAGAIGIVGETHLKMQVKQGDSNVFDCIGFGLGKLKEALLRSNSFDMCFSIEENSWKDRRNIQLNIKDIRILEGNNVI
ncbi:MAG: single-stranded-DNA-specific exonuclease RecJ [Sphingobacteriales bacterium]|nr:single-stranded-DNA-specific exonuclease RecJ [Sphingobacteriales bacterium]